MSSEAIKEDWDVLTKFFPAGWREKAYETRALLRRKKIDSADTLLRVLLIHLADGMSLRTTAAYAREAGLCQIKDTALLHRLRASGDWLLWMANKLRGQVQPLIETTELERANRVKLIDASQISEPGSTGSDWRLHYSFHVPSFRCATFKITDCSVGESLTNFPVEKDDLLVGDRAYCKRRGIFHVLENGGQVLVRFHTTSLPLSTYRGNKFELLPKLRALNSGAIGDWDVYFSDGRTRKVKGRICAIRKSEEAIAMAKKKILRQASKKQHVPRPETLEYAEYFTVFTTATRHTLKKHDALNLYRVRWQVELAFKRLKSIMNFGHLPKHDVESCKAWLHGKLFVAMLVERLYQEAESFSPWGYPIEKSATKSSSTFSK